MRLALLLATNLFKINCLSAVTHARNDPRSALRSDSNLVPYLWDSSGIWHDHSVPQPRADCYRCGKQTAPVPRNQMA